MAETRVSRSREGTTVVTEDAHEAEAEGTSETPAGGPSPDGAAPEATSPAAPGPAPSPLAVVLAEGAAMVRFYSRLPLPRLGPADDPAAPPPFGRAIRLLPLAGLVVALPSAVVVALLAASDLPDLVVGLLAVAVMAYVTGAFHEDGIADVADGFGGGMTAERRLEIMKDSRIGAFGGVALSAQFLLRASLVAEVVRRHDGLDAALVVLAVAALARVLPLALMVGLPPARPDGLGRAAGRPETAALAVALAGGGLFALAVFAPVAGGPAAMLALGLAGAAVLGLGALARAKIGGFTGDVVGAGTIVAEIAALIGLVA